jgi:hypothetical protein
MWDGDTLAPWAGRALESGSSEDRAARGFQIVVVAFSRVARAAAYHRHYTVTVMTQSQYTLSWVLSLVRASFHSQLGDLSYQVFVQRLWTEMEGAQVPQIIRTPPQQMYSGQVFQYQQAPHEVQELAVEAFFYLIRNGYAVEKPTGDFLNQPSSQWYRWTERGRQWISGVDPVPEDAEGYLHFLQLRITQLDPVIQQYIVEAVIAFGRQAHFAAAVMLGAASEKALYGLAESLLVAIKTKADREKLQDLLDRRRLHVLFEFVRDSIANASKTKLLPYWVAEGSTTHLMSIYEAMRVQRNDAVHPMNASVSADSVRFLLVSFPYTMESTEALRAWFLNNPLSI